MKPNDIVKFKNETANEMKARCESGIIMVVVWVDAPRMMVESKIPGWIINPTSIHNIEEMETI